MPRSYALSVMLLQIALMNEGNLLCNPVYESAAYFHDDFFYSFIFQNDGYNFELSDDGIIRIKTDCFNWEVDSKTFELPEDPL